MSDSPSHYPVISVLLPVRNGMPHLPKAVDSILRQTFASLELLIIDDGSEDSTSEYCRSLADPRIRYFRLESCGIANALNFGLKEARSEIVARMDADDISATDRLQRQHDYLKANSVVLLSCGFSYINERDDVISHFRNPVADVAVRWRMLFTPPFVHPGCMFLKTTALNSGGYQPKFRVAQDYDFYTRMAAYGRLGNCAEPLILYRRSSGGLSVTNSVEQITNAAVISARYAGSFIPEINSEAWLELHGFLAQAIYPKQHGLLELAKCFAKARSYFLGCLNSEDPELLDSISEFEQSFRWRCYDPALRRGLSSNLEAWRAARTFDPQRGGVLALVRRRLQRFRSQNSSK